MELRQCLIEKSNHWQGNKAAPAFVKINLDKCFKVVPFIPMQWQADNSPSHKEQKSLSRSSVPHSAKGFIFSILHGSGALFWHTLLMFSAKPRNCSWIHGVPPFSGCLNSLRLAQFNSWGQAVSTDKGRVSWGREHFLFVRGVAAFSFQAFFVLCDLSESSCSLAKDWISIFLSN